MTKNHFKTIRHNSPMMTILIVIMGFIVPTVVQAQNNPYKIDDRLYELFVEADNSYNNIDKKCLRQAEDMYKAAVKLKDKKAQSLAHTIPVHYYYKTDDIPNLIRAVDEMKKVSRATGYLRYYYFAWGKLIDEYLVNSNTYQALQECTAMQKQALADDDKYGIRNSLLSLGNIYSVRGQQEIAVNYFKEGLEYTLKNLPEQDPSVFFINLTHYYREQKQFNKALSYAERGLKNVKQKRNSFRLRIHKAICYYGLNRQDEFKKQYDELMSDIKNGKMTNVFVPYSTYGLMQIYHYILNKDYEAAHKIADKLPEKVDQYKYHAEIYSAEGKWNKAFEYQAKANEQNRLAQVQVQNDDIAGLSGELGNERLKSVNLALELENANSKAERTRLMAEQEKSVMAMKQLRLDNDILKMRQLRTTDSLRMAEITAKKTKAESERKQLEAQHRQLVMGVFFLVTLLVITLVYLLKSRKLIDRLKQSNEQLTIARNKAQEADRLKTMFVQNVSHEIRTPLNAIIGFTQVLTDPDSGLDGETRTEYMNIIQHNSEMLTGLVNDILTLSDLQSGRQKPDIAKCKCNHLCRMTLASVRHRKPESVSMTFESDAPDILEIETNERRLSQILINFLTNAEKFTTQGEIKLKCSLVEKPGFITFSVSDTGLGIPLEEQSKLFRRFEKLGGGFTQGMGLGLHISALVAEQLNAQIGIDPTYTSGARFYIAIPSVWGGN